MIAMIPARMGSQRLPKKNLMLLSGTPLIVHAIRKCVAAGQFDEIWVNSEHPDFGRIALEEGVNFHRRPEALGDNNATSEDFVAEFLGVHECDFVVQVHSIAPLLMVEDIRGFCDAVATCEYDALMSVIDENLECMFDDAPINFTFTEKTNSQDLTPIRRIVWAITAWRRDTFLAAKANGICATYAGKIGYVGVDRLTGHVIKTQGDLEVAEALFTICR